MFNDYLSNEIIKFDNKNFYFCDREKTMMNSKKVRIQTTLDSEIYNNIIKKLLPKYGQLNRLIEEAVKYLYAKEMNEVTELDHLLVRMMKEVGMVAIGFLTSFLYLLFSFSTFFELKINRG